MKCGSYVIHRFGPAQGDGQASQLRLTNSLTAMSNGSKLTMGGSLRLCNGMYERQKRENSKLQYEAVQNQIACAEIALISEVYGDGSVVPVGYVKAV